MRKWYMKAILANDQLLYVELLIVYGGGMVLVNDGVTNGGHESNKYREMKKPS